MATYTEITDEEIDQDSPITQTLMTKYRDNLIATAEGATGAPRIKLPSLEPISAGSTVRLSRALELSGPAIDFTIIGMRFLQIGSIRGSIELIEPASTTAYAYFRRTRDGVTTTLYTAAHTAGTWGYYSYDFTFLPNDVLTIEVTLPGTGQKARNATFMTAGENIWPVDDPIPSIAVLTNDYT